MPEPRVLSSRDLLFAKVVLPAITILGIAAMTWRFGAAPRGALSWIHSVVNLAVWGPSLWFLFVCSRFKRVALTDTSLQVSNLRHEIVVPLREVERVSERLVPLRAIVLELTQPTRFGRRIEFSPSGSSHPPPPHPLVAELRNAVAAAKEAKETGSARG